jgi:hypothetical protein
MKPNSHFTVHTSRTMMFSELAKVMDYAAQDDRYIDALHENITNKRTKINQGKTLKLLAGLYRFDPGRPEFKCFKYFWQRAGDAEKSTLALLYAISGDYLLAESIPVVLSVSAGDKVHVEKFKENLDACHPERYSENTKHSIAQNLASSWKQAGYIEGKVKSIRRKTTPGYLAAAFALLLAWLHGLRGDYMLHSKWVRALALSDARLRELAFEASKRDLLQYRFSGDVTTISFDNLLEKIGVHGI